ncbi:MAG: glycerophosphodiester phosphodiesterase [Candidatus Geothermincolia bacterium]
MRLIAHRGGRGFGTDNTLEAMEKAVSAGVRAIETDVRSTSDGELLICHDGSIWGHLVSRTTFAEMRKHSPERPLLSEVLERLAGWVSFNIEIKEAPARDVAAALELYGIAGDTVVTSFDWDIIKAYKEANPAALTGHLYRMPYGWDKKLHRTVHVGGGIIAPYFNSIDRELIEKAHGMGLQVYAWTVNDEHDFRKLYGWGVDAIITDRYLRMKELLASLEAGGGLSQSGG